MSLEPNQPNLDDVSGSSSRREPSAVSLTHGGSHVSRKSVIREYAEAIVVAMLLAFAIRVFVVQAFKIPSGSMIPKIGRAHV